MVKERNVKGITFKKTGKDSDGKAVLQSTRFRGPMEGKFGLYLQTGELLPLVSSSFLSVGKIRKEKVTKSLMYINTFLRTLHSGEMEATQSIQLNTQRKKKR